MSNTKYKTVLMFAETPNCRYYDKPRHTIEVTLEENLKTAIGSLQSALKNKREGLQNQEYVRWCKRNLKKAIKLIRKAELK